MSNNDSENYPDNPYQATPTAQLPVDYGNRKPTSITVFGIINVVFAAMGVCAVVWLMAAASFDIEQGDNPLQEFTDSPAYTSISMVEQGFGFLLTIVLLIAGIGLINGKPYGRKLSIIYAIAFLVLIVVMIITNVAFIMLPAMAKANEMPEGMDRMTLMMMGPAFGIGPVCNCIYPILLLIFMNRAPVVNYMRAQQNA